MKVLDWFSARLGLKIMAGAKSRKKKKGPGSRRKKNRKEKLRSQQAESESALYGENMRRALTAQGDEVSPTTWVSSKKKNRDPLRQQGFLRNRGRKKFEGFS